jgi:hypothetical protein
MKVKMILPALTEAISPYWRPIKYSLFPPLTPAPLFIGGQAKDGLPPRTGTSTTPTTRSFGRQGCQPGLSNLAIGTPAGIFAAGTPSSGGPGTRRDEMIDCGTLPTPADGRNSNRCGIGSSRPGSCPSVGYLVAPAAIPASAPLEKANCRLYPPHGPTTSSTSPAR